MIFKKPIFIYATDINQYFKERNFYIDFYALPFPIAESADQLYQNITNYNPDCFIPRYQDFLNDIGFINDGHASIRVAKLIDSIKKD